MKNSVIQIKIQLEVSTDCMKWKTEYQSWNPGLSKYHTHVHVEKKTKKRMKTAFKIFGTPVNDQTSALLVQYAGRGGDNRLKAWKTCL